MAVKIARGSSGQADFSDSYNSSNYAEEYWYLSNGSETLSETLRPYGWNVTFGGQITVPNDASLGVFTARAFQATSSDLRQNDTYEGNENTYEFEVVCMTTEVTVNSTLNQQLPDGTYKHSYTAHAENEGGTGPFTYAWTVPGTVTGGAGTESIDFYVITNDIGSESGWGSASVTVTDADGCTASDSTDVANTGGGGNGSGSGSGSGSGTNAPPGPGCQGNPCLGCC